MPSRVDLQEVPSTYPVYKKPFAYYLLCLIEILLAAAFLVFVGNQISTTYNHNLLLPLRTFTNDSTTDFITTYGSLVSDQRYGFLWWGSLLFVISAAAAIVALGQRLSQPSTEAAYNISMLALITSIVLSIVTLISYARYIPSCNSDPLMSGIAGSFDNMCNDPKWCGVYGEDVPSCPNFRGLYPWLPVVTKPELVWDLNFIIGFSVTVIYLGLSIAALLTTVFSSRKLIQISPNTDYNLPVFYSNEPPNSADDYSGGGSGKQK